MSTPPPPVSAASTTLIPRPALSRRAAVVSWIFQLIAAGLFLNFGLGKVTGSNASAIETFEQIGLGQWFRVFIGCLEVAGAIGLLIPMFAALAAACLAALAVGATGIVLFVVGGSILSLMICLTAVLIVLVLRRQTLLAPFAFARRSRRRTS
jgi:putative oxidoreductase